tara:strand:- start:4782 stop:4901 length:120 start_codon:yes stop_codon:yes gene_type:complete
MGHINNLIKKAHYNLTWKVGKRGYSPTTKEVENEIKLIK